MRLIRASGADGLSAVRGVLFDTSMRLRSQNRPPWPSQFTYDRLVAVVARGDLYLAIGEDGWAARGTITVSAFGDPAFWRPRELAEPASYVTTMARADSTPGLGGAMLAWAVNAAHERGDRWVRLDAGRGNDALQEYYLGQGFARVRTEEAPGRKSGALFQRLALPTEHPFTEAPALPDRKTITRPLGILSAGDEVFTADWHRGTVTEVLDPGAGMGIVTEPWEYGTGRPPVDYRVKMDDDGEVVIGEGDVTEAASMAMAEHT